MRRACANNRKGEQSILPWKATPGCAGAKRSDTRAAPSCSGNRMPFRDSWTPPTLETWTGGSQQGGGSPGGDPCVWEGGGQRMSHGKRPGVAGGLISQANRPLARRSRWAFGGDLEGPSQSKLALEWWWWLAGGGGVESGGWVGVDKGLGVRNPLRKQNEQRNRSGEISKNESERKCHPLPCQATKQPPDEISGPPSELPYGAATPTIPDTYMVRCRSLLLRSTH